MAQNNENGFVLFDHFVCNLLFYNNLRPFESTKLHKWAANIVIFP